MRHSAAIVALLAAVAAAGGIRAGAHFDEARFTRMLQAYSIHQENGKIRPEDWPAVRSYAQLPWVYSLPFADVARAGSLGGNDFVAFATFAAGDADGSGRVSAEPLASMRGDVFARVIAQAMCPRRDGVMTWAGRQRYMALRDTAGDVVGADGHVRDFAQWAAVLAEAGLRLGANLSADVLPLADFADASGRLRASAFDMVAAFILLGGTNGRVDVRECAWPAAHIAVRGEGPVGAREWMAYMRFAKASRDAERADEADLEQEWGARIPANGGTMTLLQWLRFARASQPLPLPNING